MKIIFFGLGSIGLRHAKILKEISKAELFAYRTYKGQRANDLDIKEVTSWKEVDRIQPDVAFITNPTSLHIETSLQCARRGINLFIEKPLDSRITHLKKLLKIVSARNLVTYVAYVLRFHPVILDIKRYIQKYHFLHMRVLTTSYLPLWRSRRSRYKNYSAHLKMGGGVIFDLSHELDYVQHLLGDIKRLEGKFERRANLTVDAEDYADILVETKKGPANVHIDFLSHVKQRLIQVDFKEKSIVGDLVENTLTEFANGKTVRRKKFRQGIKDCYLKQLRYFRSNLKNQRMMNNIHDAAHLFRKIYFFKQKGSLHSK